MEQIVVLTVDPVPATNQFRMRFTTVDYMFTGLPASFPITLDGQRMEKIRRYTMRLLRWIGRQPQWFCRDDDMPYVLVPIKMEARDAAMFDFEEHIDMYEVARLGEWTTKPVLESGMTLSLAQFSDRILLEQQLPPTNLWVHAISASVYRSGLVMPTILARIRQAPSAQRCNEEIFEGNVAATHFIEALTAPSPSHALL
ncbi:hypothetical protein CF326_g352 [Tilletia indica]|nr:hypothetical protein CF326_g352 [Tilletia indica]